MKKTVITLAVLATLSTGSYAQSTSNVTLYGIVDAGVAYTNNGAAGNASTLSVGSGFQKSSRWGIPGTEDMGGGLKAKFQLEAGFDADTGAAKTYSGNPSTATPAAPGGAPVTGLFNRRSYVGLEGAFGSIIVGRDYTPIYWALQASDAQALDLYGSVQELVQLSGTGGDRFGRASNAVFYESPSMNGFKGRAMYSLGSESAGGAGAPPKDANHIWSVSGQYEIGGLLLSSAYQEIKLPTVAGTGASATFTGATGTRRDIVLGAKYNFSDYSVAAGYFKAKQPTKNTDASDIWLGATAKLGTGTVLVDLQRLRQDVVVGAALTAPVFSLSYVYPLSKQTSLYASSGLVKNRSTAAFALVASDPTVAAGAPGATVKALALGITRKF